MLHIADSIERKLVLNAPRHEVWRRSFATPDALSSWFPDRIEGDFVVGQPFTLIWGEHRCEGMLVAYSPDESLAYQWHPGGACKLDAYPANQLTTVTFTLRDHGNGTEVQMIESGFSTIDQARGDEAFSENNRGWDSEMPKLSKIYA